MQLPSGRRRPIQQSFRPEGQSLAYEKLSDPILVKRAKDGDPQALEVWTTVFAVGALVTLVAGVALEQSGEALARERAKARLPVWGEPGLRRTAGA